MYYSIPSFLLPIISSSCRLRLPRHLVHHLPIPSSPSPWRRREQYQVAASRALLSHSPACYCSTHTHPEMKLCDNLTTRRTLCSTIAHIVSHYSPDSLTFICSTRTLGLRILCDFGLCAMHCGPGTISSRSLESYIKALLVHGCRLSPSSPSSVPQRRPFPGIDWFIRRRSILLDSYNHG